MMRCLGIDYGTRRIGLSYGDAVGVATPLPALVQADAAARTAALERVVLERQITDIVLGYPYNMDGSAGFKAREVDGFAAELRTRFGLPVHLVDERLTSYDGGATPFALGARRSAKGTHKKGKTGAKSGKGGLQAAREFRASGVLDSRAATLILQDFLSQRVPAPLAAAFLSEEEGADGAP